MANKFRMPKHQDFEITDGDEVVGAVRVKPSGILWSPKGEHSWYRVSLKQLAEFAIANGKKQKK